MDTFENLLPLAWTLQLFSAFFMTGLIWLVQIVHYPAFASVDSTKFVAFHAFHSSRITWIVFPVMTLELVTAVALVAGDASSRIWWLNLIGVIAIWGATGLVSVPLHNQLGSGWNEAVVARLVTTNWIRTLLWSTRSALLVWLLFQTVLQAATARPFK